MKRLVQFVAILTVALLAFVPAVAALTCRLSDSAAASACPMDMSSMGADCPMARMEGSGCAQDCCAHPLAVSAAPMTAAARPKLAADFSAVRLSESKAASPGFSSRLRAPIDISPPPRYILNRIFRI